MAYDLQDQEELDNFKRIWSSWGKWVFLLLVLISLGYFGNTVYQGHQETKNEEAAAILSHLIDEANAKNQAAVLVDLKNLQENYPNSIAATQATFMEAATAFDAGEYAQSEKHLGWIREHNKSALVNALLLQRTATIKLQENKLDEALALAQTKVDPSYAGVMLELEGDIYVAKGDSKTAKEKYQAALEKADKELPGYELLQLKAAQS